MDTVDTGSPRASCGNCVHSMREAMLQLICSNLDCNHGALHASLVLWLGKFLQIIADSGTVVTSLLTQYLILAQL